MKNKLKDYFLKDSFTCIMIIITFIIGLLFFMASYGYPWNIRFWIIILGFVPFIGYFVTLVLIDKGYRKIAAILKWLLTIFLVFYYFFALIMSVMLEIENPVIDTKYYQSKVKGERLLKAFPKEIPSQAEEISFIYMPGFLQGGEEYALYYIDPDFVEAEFDEKYRNQAIWIGYQKEYTLNEGLFSGAFYNTPAEYKNENDFKIYLLEGRCDNSGYCNHGDFLFAAYNEKTNEIIYRSSQW